MAPEVIVPGSLPDTRERHYSQARIDGDTLYVSGMAGRDADFEPAGDDVGTQTRQAFENIETVLAEADRSLEDVAKVTGYLVDAQANYPGYEEVYMATFDEPPYPCHTAIGIDELVLPGFLVEIDVVVPL